MKSPNSEVSSLAAFAATWKATLPSVVGEIHSIVQLAVSVEIKSLPNDVCCAY